MIASIRISLKGLLALAAGLSWLAAAGAVQAQVPDDFRLVLSSRPTHLYDPLDEQGVVITAEGEVYVKPFRIGGEGGQYHEELRTTLSDEQMSDIYAAVLASNFFALDEEYENRRVSGGDQATLAIRAEGQEHAVTTINIPQADVDSIAGTVNRQLPEGHKIYYNALVYPQLYPEPEEDAP